MESFMGSILVVSGPMKPIYQNSGGNEGRKSGQNISYWKIHW
jgi:hypothetical protein